MKTLLLIVIAWIGLTANAQTPIKLAKARVGNDQILQNWKVDEVKEFNNVKIKRVEGENGINDLTNVSYIPKHEILYRINQKAEVDALYKKEQEDLINYYDQKAPGGQIALFYYRTHQSAADPRNFTVMVKDADNGHILYQEKLDFEKPHKYKWGIWYFYKTVNIPVEVGEKFNVTVTDVDLQKSYDFLVYDNFPEVIPPASVISAGK